jgi:hypothetical protein
MNNYNNQYSSLLGDYEQTQPRSRFSKKQGLLAFATLACVGTIAYMSQMGPSQQELLSLQNYMV